MKKNMSLMLALALSALFAAVAQAAPLQVAVGVAPVASFAKKVGGALIQTTVLVPGGADAHTYEPKPSQMRALSASALYLSTGLEFEEAWEKRVKSANPRLAYVHVAEGVKRLPMPEGHGHAEGDHGHKQAGKGHHDEAESDPHVWVAPSSAKVMAANIARALAKADPANAKAYEANLAGFLREVDALDAQLRGVFVSAPADKRGFLVFHPAWGYFAKDYGLTQQAIEFEGKEPSPRRLAVLISQAKAKGYKVVFVQPQMSRRTAETIAQAIGAKIVLADPLAEDWAGNLKAVAEGFRSALK